MASEKPRLLYILHAFNNRGGTEEHVRTLAKGLADEFDIAILYPEKLQLHLRLPDGRVGLYPAEEVRFPLTPYQLPLIESSVRQVIESFRPDLVHVQHFIYWPLGILDLVHATGIPAAVSFHDYYPITPYFTMEQVADPHECFSTAGAVKVFGKDISLYLAQRRDLLRESLAKFRCCICPSQALARELGTIYPLPYRIVAHGIVPFAPLPHEASPTLRFGYVGSLLPQKGWLPLVEAFEKVHARHPGSELHFYGGHRELTHPAIHFHGIYDQPDLPRILAGIDVGVIPSVFRETFSLVLSEMWHARVCPAVSAIGALAERVTDGVDGRTFRPGDRESMAETLSWFAEHDEWRAWKMPAVRTASEMCAEYREIYRELIGGRP